MTVAAVIVAPDPDRTQLRLVVLRQWIEAGMALARRMSEGTERSLVEGAFALLRITQAVRLAFVLIARLSDPHSLFHPAPAKPRPSQDCEPEARSEAQAEAHAEPRDRLRLPGEPVSDAAILRRPLAEIVKVICKALGVTPDWSLWSDSGRPRAEPHPGPAAAPPPSEPRREIPRPPPRPHLILDPACARPVVGPRRASLRSSCALQPLLPLAAPASGRRPLPGTWAAGPTLDSASSPRRYEALQP